MATPQEIASALKYGPQTSKLVRRSGYLDALLKQSTQPEQPIRSPAELAARLMATALLSRASNKASDATLGAMKADQSAETQRLVASLGGGAKSPPPMTAVGPPPVQTPPAAAAPPAPTFPEPALAPQPQPQPAGLHVSPQDRDALIRMVVTEAGGEGPDGMAATAHVALNRLKTGHGGARSLRDVVMAPHQFEGMSRANQVRPEDYDRGAQIVDAVLAGGSQDPTGGAVNFLNPDLQVQLGRQIPAWAQGQGQRIGRHVFFGGQPGAQRQAQTAPSPPNPQGPADQPVEPYQVASIGQTPPPPSAPDRSPPDAGAPPAAAPPQAAAAGGQPQWPTYQPTEQEISWARALAEDPRTHDMGMAELRKLQQKMTQPVEATIQMINGAPFYVPKTPGQGPLVAIPVPPEAMTRQVDARSINPTATAGTQAQVGPLGDVKPGIGGPPENMQAVRSEDGQLKYVPVQGSKEDPYRVQPPGPNYQYGPAGSQSAIPGSAADLKNPANVMEGANRMGGMVKTIVDGAMKVKQNFGAVQTGYRQRNGTGDIAMVNGIQKLIDEGVVKGEDVNMQMKSNGLQGTLGSWSQYAQSGGLFTDDVRQKVYKTAEDLYQNLDRTYRARVTSLQPGFDEAYGQGAFSKYVFPDAFAEELGWRGEPKPAAAEAPAQTPDAAKATFKQLYSAGKIDTKEPLGSEKHPFLPSTQERAQALDIPANKGKYVILPSGALVVID